MYSGRWLAQSGATRLEGDSMIIKKRFTQWVKSFQNQWSEKQYIRAGLTFILPLAVLALLVAFIILTVTMVFNFLRRYYAQILFAAFAICVFIAWLDKRKTQNIDLKRKEQEVRERQDYSDRLEAARTKDTTYTMQAKILFSVVRELGPLGIVPPATLSNIYSPGRIISKAGGTVNVSLYLLQKDCETVDTDLLKHTLQTKIDQRLQAGEFPGIPEQHVYRGRVYSGFVVDTVRDSLGGFVEVYTALVNDAYCRYLERRNLNSSILLPSVDRRDMDY